MSATELPPAFFAVDVIATVRADDAGLSRWIHGGDTRRCAGASPAAMTLRDRVRVAARDAAEALQVARRGMLESATDAGMQLGCVHAQVLRTPVG